MTGRSRFLAIGAVGILAAVAAVVSWRWHSSRIARQALYRDSFRFGKQDNWQPYGGAWEVVDGAMRNNSDERGAKTMNGDTESRNYLVEADVQLLGQYGDAGLIIRANDEEVGVDAYNGYYAGLRDLDNTLILGRAGFGWIE
jgi:hypothetical protein